MTCMCLMFDIQRHRAKRESGAGMLLDQKATEEEERGEKRWAGTDRNIQCIIL